MTLTLRPNAAAVGVPTLSIEGDYLVVTTAEKQQTHLLADVILAAFTYRIRIQTSGLTRYNVLLEDRSGRPLAWLGNLDIEPYPGVALSEFATRAGIPLQVRGELPFSAVASIPDEARIGPGTSRAGSVVAPLRQWLMCLVLIGGVAPLVLVGVEHWSRWWWLLLVPLWSFGSFFVMGALQSGMKKDDAAWVRGTRLKAALAVVVTALGVVGGVLGYGDGGPVPGWLGVWVAAGALILLAGWLLALEGTWRPAARRDEAAQV